MSQNESGTALIEATNETAPTEWGTRAAIKENADRIRRFMPGGDKLTGSQSLVAAQYAHLADANIFRGEIYVYPDKGGNLVLVDGYKLLVRWARRQCQFYDRYDKLEGLEDGDIGYRCRLLRDDARHHLLALTNAGCDFEFAFDLVTSSAVGIVRKADMWSTRHNKPIPPPKGWNWDQVARKRALKNTLNIAYGMPSPREIAAEGWKVGDTETIPDDWAECTPEMLPEARERLAAMTAQERMREPDDRSAEEILAANGVILHGDEAEI